MVQPPAVHHAPCLDVVAQRQFPVFANRYSCRLVDAGEQHPLVGERVDYPLIEIVRGDTRSKDNLPLRATFAAVSVCESLVAGLLRRGWIGPKLLQHPRLLAYGHTAYGIRQTAYGMVRRAVRTLSISSVRATMWSC